MNNSEKLLSLMADLNGDIENFTITKIDSNGDHCVTIRVFGEDKTITKPSRDEVISATIKLITNALRRQAQELESKNKRQLRIIEIAKRDAENFTKLADIYSSNSKEKTITVKIDAKSFTTEQVKDITDRILQKVTITEPKFKEGDRVFTKCDNENLNGMFGRIISSTQGKNSVRLDCNAHNTAFRDCELIKLAPNSPIEVGDEVLVKHRCNDNGKVVHLSADLVAFVIMRDGSSIDAQLPDLIKIAKN